MKKLPNPIVIHNRILIRNTWFFVRPSAGGVWSSYLVVSKRTWVLSNHQIWRLYSQYKRSYPDFYFSGYNGFILCQECIYVSRVYFFENQDRFLQYGLIAEYRCFNSVWHSPGAVHSQILKRIGHREAYDRHRYMCTHFGAKMSLGHANLSEFNHMEPSRLRSEFSGFQPFGCVLTAYLMIYH